MFIWFSYVCVYLVFIYVCLFGFQRLSRELYSSLQQIDDEVRQEDEFGDSDHNTCPNPQVKFKLNYAHSLRENLKDMVGKSYKSTP